MLVKGAPGVDMTIHVNHKQGYDWYQWRWLIYTSFFRDIHVRAVWISLDGPLSMFVGRVLFCIWDFRHVCHGWQVQVAGLQRDSRIITGWEIGTSPATYLLGMYHWYVYRNGMFATLYAFNVFGKISYFILSYGWASMMYYMMLWLHQLLAISVVLHMGARRSTDMLFNIYLYGEVSMIYLPFLRHVFYPH